VHAADGPASGAPDDDDALADDEAEDALDALDEVALDPPALDDEVAVLLPLPLQPTPTISDERRGTARRAGDIGAATLRRRIAPVTTQRPHCG